MLLHHLRTSYKKPKTKGFQKQRNSNKYYTQGDSNMLRGTNNSFRCIVSSVYLKKGLLKVSLIILHSYVSDIVDMSLVLNLRSFWPPRRIKYDVGIVT